MKDKKDRFIQFIKKVAKKKRTWVLLVLVVIFLIYIFKPAASTQTVVLDKATYVDLKQTVLATGQVTSNTDLALSFNSSGIVKTLKVKVGDVVKKGDILATIDQGSALAVLTQARGAYASAQARLKKTIEGSSNEEINLAQVALDQAKLTQKTLVDNAYQNLLNSTPEAVPDKLTNDYAAPTISGTYTLGKEGSILIKMYSSTGGYAFNFSGLVNGSGNVATNTSQPLGNSGLYIKFPSTASQNILDWVIAIPNMKASNYLANYNAYQQALTQSQSTIDQKAAELAVKKAQARGADIDLAQADIISAEGQLQAAQTKYDDTILRAPADGTITSIDIKLGEISEAQKPVIVLQDVSNLYIEAKINESSIANVVIGQKVSMTFDAFGTSRIFDGVVMHVDPGATTTDGIVNYKIKVSINSTDPAIRSGMNADIAIVTGEKTHALVIPKAAIISHDGKFYVNVVSDVSDKKYKEQEIQTGLTGDGNRIEVTSGLSEGADIAIVSK